jgi:hypothetical protein
MTAAGALALAEAPAPAPAPTGSSSVLEALWPATLPAPSWRTVWTVRLLLAIPRASAAADWLTGPWAGPPESSPIGRLALIGSATPAPSEIGSSCVLEALWLAELPDVPLCDPFARAALPPRASSTTLVPTAMIWRFKMMSPSFARRSARVKRGRRADGVGVARVS